MLKFTDFHETGGVVYLDPKIKPTKIAEYNGHTNIFFPTQNLWAFGAKPDPFGHIVSVKEKAEDVYNAYFKE